MERLSLKENEETKEIHPAILSILKKTSTLINEKKLQQINNDKYFKRRTSNLSTSSTKELISIDVKMQSNNDNNVKRSDFRRKSIYISSKDIVKAKLDYNFNCLDELLTKKRKRSISKDKE